MVAHSSILAWRIPTDRGACWGSSQRSPMTNSEIVIKFNSRVLSGIVLEIKETVCVCVCVCAQSLQSCPTFCDPMNCSLPGTSVYGILQARILEWVAISFSRGSFQPRDRTLISYISCIGRQLLDPLKHLGSPRKQYNDILIV